MDLKTCNIFGRCRDRKTGKLTSKISELHRDLLGLGLIQKAFTRLKANKAFYLSLSPKFLERYEEDLVFTSEDADAEPKLASFFEAALSIMPEVKMEDIRTLLAKKFKEGVYSYEDAFLRMLQFNQQMDGGTMFISTLVPQENGKYMFKIVPNSALEQLSLIQTISDRKTAEAIIQQLKNLGVGIAEGTESLYNSKNPKVLVDGLLGLITLKGGEKASAYNIKDLASETGHTIIGMLGDDNKLYQRFHKYIEEHPEIAKELLGELEYIRYKDTSNETREFMGHIVGLYLEQWDSIKPNTKLKTLGTLIQRMIDWLQSKLHFTNRDYYSALYNAKWDAYNMVKDFMGNNFLGNVNNALQHQEVLHGSLNVILEHLRNSILKLDTLVEGSKDIHYKVYKNFNDVFRQLVSEFNEIKAMQKESERGYFDKEAIEKNSAAAILKLGKFLKNQLELTQFLLEKATQGLDAKSESISLAEQAKVIKYSLDVLDYIKYFLLYKNDFEHFENDELKNSVLKVFAALTEASSIHNRGKGSDIIEEVKYKESYQDYIDEVRKNLSLRLLAQINGSDFIALGQHVHFKDGKLVRSAPLIKNITDLFNEPIRTGLWTRLIDSIADNPDIINQLVYNIVEEKKHQANVETLNIKDRLFDLYRELRAINIRDTRLFYELDSEGKITGNLVSERNWGEWERLYKKEKDDWVEKWWENNHESVGLPSKLDMYNNTIFLAAFGAWREGWHNKHSTKIKLTDEEGNVLKYDDGKPKKRWAPAIKSDAKSYEKTVLFDSEQYAELKPEAKEWLKKYMSLKREMDDMLPDGSTNAFGVRAPLFTGTITDRFTNTLKGANSVTNNPLTRVMGMSFRKFVIHNVAASPDDTEYGGENNAYGSEDLRDSEGSLIFTRAVSNARNSIDRVPLYGIKKLPNLNDLSTDLIQSSIAYAAMATSYKCLSEVAGVASELAEARRRLHELKDPGTSKSGFFSKLPLTGYSRLADYLLLQVYNNYADPSNRWARKVSGLVASFGSLWMLGFNWHSALTNAYTAWNEIWKEAHSGEDFRKRDFIWAAGVYAAYWFIGFLQEMCNIVIKDGSITEPTTKMHLFLKMMDFQNENERKFRDYHIQTVGWQTMKRYNYVDWAMAPYTATDKWMLAMAFLACAHRTKLRNKSTGKECSLWDAYTVKLEKGKEPRLVLKGDEKDWTIYDKNQALLNQILSDKASKEPLTIKEAKTIYRYKKVPSRDSKGNPIEIEDFEKDAEGNNILIDPWVPFDLKLLNKFRLRCKGINNRMHGIYNRGDGGAFQQFWWATMAASMKKYAIGLIDRRFSATRYDFRTGEMRLGSTVTMANILVDCYASVYSTEDTSKVVQFFDNLNYSDGWYILGTLGKLIYGTAKFLYITIGPSPTRFGVDEYLRKRGYSNNQIANVRRFFGDIFRPLLIELEMSLLEPPGDDDDKDEEAPWYKKAQKELREGADMLLSNTTFSKMLTYFYSEQNKLFGEAIRWAGLGRGATVKDEVYLKEKNLDRVIKKNYGKEYQAFDVRAILYYQLYRGLLEQKAYNISSVFSMYKEYEGLLSSALPGTVSIYSLLMTIGAITEKASDEELRGKSKTERKAYRDGRKIYVKGNKKGWYKWTKEVLKVGPTRTLEMWYDGYASLEAMQHFKEPYLKEEGPGYEGKFTDSWININRR